MAAAGGAHYFTLPLQSVRFEPMLPWEETLNICLSLHEVRLALAELKHALHKIYGERLQGVYLYGSYARGDFHAGSDIDVLVALAGQVKPAKEIDRVNEAVSDIGLRYDLLLAIYPTSVDWFFERQSPFFKNVRREAVPI